MTVLNFPATPILNQTYTENDIIYTWNGNYWEANNVGSLNDLYVEVAGDNMVGPLTLGTNKIILNDNGKADFANNVTTSAGTFDIASDTGVGTRLNNGGSVLSQRPTSVGVNEPLFRGYYGSSENFQVQASGSVEIGGTLPADPNIMLDAADGSITALSSVTVGSTTSNSTTTKGSSLNASGCVTASPDNIDDINTQGNGSNSFITFAPNGVDPTKKKPVFRVANSGSTYIGNQTGSNVQDTKIVLQADGSITADGQIRSNTEFLAIDPIGTQRSRLTIKPTDDAVVLTATNTSGTGRDVFFDCGDAGNGVLVGGTTASPNIELNAKDGSITAAGLIANGGGYNVGGGCNLFVNGAGTTSERGALGVQSKDESSTLGDVALFVRHGVNNNVSINYGGDIFTKGDVSVGDGAPAGGTGFRQDADGLLRIGRDLGVDGDSLTVINTKIGSKGIILAGSNSLNSTGQTNDYTSTIYTDGSALFDKIVTSANGGNYANLQNGRVKAYREATTTSTVWEGGFGTTSTSLIRANGSALFEGNVSATIVPPSDARFKENIEPAKPQLADVVALGGLLKNYDWNDQAPLSEELRSQRQLGLIAQEAAEVCPAIVKDINRTKTVEVKPAVTGPKGRVITEAVTKEEDDSYKGISTDALIMKMLGAITELSAEVAALKAKRKS